MGYCMNMRESNFTILKENKTKALKLLKKHVSGCERLSWVDCKTIIEAKTLHDALDECRYEIEEDNNGNVSEIYFNGEKLGDDEMILNAIAPAVSDGSYIEMLGEDGSLWRWVFNNGKCKEICPKINWIDFE